MKNPWLALAALTLVHDAAPGQPLITFARSEFATGGSQANSFAIADFNGDRRTDVALATGTGAYVLYGRGDGRFEPARTVNPGASSFAIVAADFNGDSRPDLALTNGINANTVTIVLNRGDGSFSAPQSFAAGATPMGAVAADFNADGKMDLAIANLAGLVPGIAGRTVSVLLGKGDGTFNAPVPAEVAGERPIRLAAGDFNRDGNLDLVVATTISVMSLLLGNGDGAFRAPRPLSGPGTQLPPAGITTVAVADFNLDGRADIAAQLPPNRLFILPGEGDGSFQPPRPYVMDGELFSVGDLNGDGVPDLAAASLPPAAALVVLVGVGDGSFEPEQAYEVGSVPIGVAIADFDGDGLSDVIAGRQADRNVSIFLNVTPRPVVAPNGVVHGATFLSNASTVAPGQVVTIFGRGLGPAQLVTARLKRPEFLDTELAGTRVLFDGVAAPMIFARADQVSAVVPYAVNGKPATRLQIAYGQARSVGVPLRIAPALPGIFTANASGSGQGAIVNQDGSLNSPLSPAPKRSIVTFYLTGEGQTNPPGVDGRIAIGLLPAPSLPVVVGIANMGAEIQYAGAVPGLVAGIMQINAVIPPDAPSGPAVPLVVRVGDEFSPAGVTIAIR